MSHPLMAALLLACLAGAVQAQLAAIPTPTPTPTPTPSAQAPAALGTAAGIVKRSVGKVTLERAGQTLVVQPGQVVQVGDTLRTGPASAAGITLRDDTLLTTGPDSELQITAFAFDELTQDGNLLASLWRGTLSVVTGLISKRTPDNVKVQTRTVVLGSRGTEFIVDSTGVLR